MLEVRCWMLDVGCWKLDVGCWMLDVRCWNVARVFRPALAPPRTPCLRGGYLSSNISVLEPVIRPLPTLEENYVSCSNNTCILQRGETI